MSKQELKPGEKLINLQERVEVTTTPENPFYKKVTKTMVHPLVAEKGRKNGHYEPAKKGKD